MMNTCFPLLKTSFIVGEELETARNEQEKS